MNQYYIENFLLLCLVFLLILNIQCKSKKTSNSREQIISFLINQSLTNSTDSCTSFASSEAICVSSQTEILRTCSDTEKSRLKKSIEPIEKQTNEVLDKFFDCWKKCNLIFNSQESICLESKFTKLESYRDAQKSGQSLASKNWILCTNTCNQAEAEETKTLGAIFKGWAY